MTSAAPLPTPLPSPLPATHAVPCLTYRDAPAAIRWLVDVLGAEARHVYTGVDGTVAHAEVWFGAACVMLGSPKGDGRLPEAVGTSTVYVVLATREAVDALHARVVAAVAPVPVPLHDTDYGSHDFVCCDPEGNAWSFGTYGPAPAAPAV